MTLNDLEALTLTLIALILRFLPNSIALQADYVTVVEDKTYNVHKILSPSSSLLLLAKTNAPYFVCTPNPTSAKFLQTIHRGLFAIAEHLVPLIKVF